MTLRHLHFAVTVTSNVVGSPRWWHIKACTIELESQLEHLGDSNAMILLALRLDLCNTLVIQSRFRTQIEWIENQVIIIVLIPQIDVLSMYFIGLPPQITEAIQSAQILIQIITVSFPLVGIVIDPLMPIRFRSQELDCCRRQTSVTYIMTVECPLHWLLSKSVFLVSSASIGYTWARMFSPLTFAAMGGKPTVGGHCNEHDRLADNKYGTVREGRHWALRLVHSIVVTAVHTLSWRMRYSSRLLDDVALSGSINRVF